MLGVKMRGLVGQEKEEEKNGGPLINILERP